MFCAGGGRVGIVLQFYIFNAGRVFDVFHSRCSQRGGGGGERGRETSRA